MVLTDRDRVAIEALDLRILVSAAAPGFLYSSRLLLDEPTNHLDLNAEM